MEDALFASHGWSVHDGGRFSKGTRMSRFVAVSYTHLDVYKRQGFIYIYRRTGEHRLTYARSRVCV